MQEQESIERMLVKAGYMTESQLARARTLTGDRRERERLRLLVELGYVSEENVLSCICRQEGLGALWITHSPQNALALADKALLLNRQGEYRFGLAEEALTEENLSWCLEMLLKLCRVQAGEKQGWCVLPLGSREKG